MNENRKSTIELNECYIAGLQYYDGELLDASSISYLTLQREPDNEYDPNAIEVYANSSKLGHIPRDENKIIAKLMDQNVKIYARVIDFNPENSIHEHELKSECYSR